MTISNVRALEIRQNYSIGDIEILSTLTIIVMRTIIVTLAINVTVAIIVTSTCDVETCRSLAS